MTILVFKNPNSITKHPHVMLSTMALNKGQVRKKLHFFTENRSLSRNRYKTGPIVIGLNCVKDANGKVLVENNQVKEVWRKYCTWINCS